MCVWVDAYRKFLMQSTEELLMSGDKHKLYLLAVANKVCPSPA